MLHDAVLLRSLRKKGLQCKKGSVKVPCGSLLCLLLPTGVLLLSHAVPSLMGGAP
jgi:hypothetical protein